MARLQELYIDKIRPELAEKLGRTNILGLPRIVKIVVSMGVGSAIQEKKHMEDATEALGVITGQKALVCRAKKSVSNFKLREGQAIGAKVTLRGVRAYEFLDRLVSLALPRMRDFRGIDPNGFDGHGNFSMGLAEILVFPELNPDRFQRPQGMNIAVVTSTDSDEEARMMLTAFGMPFKTDVAIKKRRAS